MPPRVDRNGVPLPPIVQAELDDNFIVHHASLLETWCNERNELTGNQLVALIDVLDAIQRIIQRDCESQA